MWTAWRVRHANQVEMCGSELVAVHAMDLACKLVVLLCLPGYIREVFISVLVHVGTLTIKIREIRLYQRRLSSLPQSPPLQSCFRQLARMDGDRKRGTHNREFLLIFWSDGPNPDRPVGRFSGSRRSGGRCPDRRRTDVENPGCVPWKGGEAQGGRGRR